MSARTSRAGPPGGPAGVPRCTDCQPSCRSSPRALRARARSPSPPARGDGPARRGIPRRPRARERPTEADAGADASNRQAGGPRASVGQRREQVRGRRRLRRRPRAREWQVLPARAERAPRNGRAGRPREGQRERAERRARLLLSRRDRNRGRVPGRGALDRRHEGHHEGRRRHPSRDGEEDGLYAPTAPKGFPLGSSIVVTPSGDVEGRLVFNTDHETPEFADGALGFEGEPDPEIECADVGKELFAALPFGWAGFGDMGPPTATARSIRPRARRWRS